MVVLDFGLKDAFIGTTQTQNLGRLLNCACRDAQEVIRDIILQVQKPNLDNLTVCSDIRQDLWERVRHLRELYLKCLVLVTMKDDATNICDMVQIGAEMWDARETVRRRAQEFFDIQWPPMGAFPPPQPPWAFDVATNVLTSSNPRTLPKYSQLCVEQCSSNPADVVRNIKLPVRARKKIAMKLSRVITSEYALALSRSQQVEKTLNFVTFRLDMGRVNLSSPGEFHVTFLTDFRRYQFEHFQVFVGEGLGYGISGELGLMGCNTLQSACNIVTDTLEALKSRALYEVNSWKALINASKETREKARDLRVLAQWLADNHNLADKTKVKLKQLERILARPPFDEVLTAGAKKADVTKLTESMDLHKDDDALLFEDAPEIEAETIKDCDEIEMDKLTRDLYSALRDMEKACTAKLIQEREDFRTIEGSAFTLEFYRFVVLVSARLSRYGSLLILRDQARNMCKCTAAPGGVIYVRDRKLTAAEKMKGSTRTREVSGWKKLFLRHYPTPLTECPSLEEEYPGAENVPFACLFTLAAMPIHTDYVDIDFLPGLPQSLFQQYLGSTHCGICRLTFGLDQSQAELFVNLQPLHCIVEQYQKLEKGMELAKGSDEVTFSESVSENLKRVIPKLYNENAFRQFYTLEEQKLVCASSSTVCGFGGRQLDLTQWIAGACEVVARLGLEGLGCAISAYDSWSFVIDGLHLELAWEGKPLVKIWMDLLTGYLCVDPTRLGRSLSDAGVDLATIVSHTERLGSPLNDGDVVGFLTSVKSVVELGKEIKVVEVAVEQIEVLSEEEDESYREKRPRLE